MRHLYVTKLYAINSKGIDKEELDIFLFEGVNLGREA